MANLNILILTFNNKFFKFLVLYGVFLYLVDGKMKSDSKKQKKSHSENGIIKVRTKI